MEIEEYCDLNELVRSGGSRRENLSKLPAGMKKRFALPRKAELEGRISNGTFCPVFSFTVRSGTRVFCSRFVNELERADVGVLVEYIFVAPHYADEVSAEKHDKRSYGAVHTRQSTVFWQRVSLITSHFRET